jgi:hypothetical protein
MEKIQEMYMFFAVIIILLLIVFAWYNNWKGSKVIYLTIDHDLTKPKQKKVYYRAHRARKGVDFVSSDLCELLKRLPEETKVLWRHDTEIINDIEYTIIGDWVNLEMQNDITKNSIEDKAVDMLFELLEEYQEKHF